MRRLSLLVFVLALTTGAAASSSAGAGNGEPTAIKGRVVDLTCFGPCAAGTNPRLFTGEADVLIHRVRSGKPAIRQAVEKGHFALDVKPGRYRLRVVPYPDLDPGCWVGSKKRVKVRRGHIRHVRLTVENVCVQ